MSSPSTPTTPKAADYSIRGKGGHRLTSSSTQRQTMDVVDALLLAHGGVDENLAVHTNTVVRLTVRPLSTDLDLYARLTDDEILARISKSTLASRVHAAKKDLKRSSFHIIYTLFAADETSTPDGEGTIMIGVTQKKKEK
jgi:hypothetical protein